LEAAAFSATDSLVTDHGFTQAVRDRTRVYRETWTIGIADEAIAWLEASKE